MRPKSEAVKRELARFRGTWVLTSFEPQGQERAQDEIKKEKLVYVFDGDKLTQKLGDKLSDVPRSRLIQPSLP